MKPGGIRAAAVLLIVLASMFSSGSIAAATPANAGPSDTGWQPDGPYGDYELQACGTTVTVTERVNRVERREVTDGRGTTVELYRGTYKVALSAPGRRTVPLDNSGPYSVVTRPNGDQLTTVLGPAFVFPLSDGESTAFRQARLPEYFYYKKGLLTLTTTAGRTTVVTKPADPTDICRLLR